MAATWNDETEDYGVLFGRKVTDIVVRDGAVIILTKREAKWDMPPHFFAPLYGEPTVYFQGSEGSTLLAKDQRPALEKYLAERGYIVCRPVTELLAG